MAMKGIIWIYIGVLSILVVANNWTDHVGHQQHKAEIERLNSRIDTLERRIELTQQHYLDCAFVTKEMVELRKGRLRMK